MTMARRSCWCTITNGANHFVNGTTPTNQKLVPGQTMRNNASLSKETTRREAETSPEPYRPFDLRSLVECPTRALTL